MGRTAVTMKILAICCFLILHGCAYIDTTFTLDNGRQAHIRGMRFLTSSDVHIAFDKDKTAITYGAKTEDQKLMDLANLLAQLAPILATGAKAAGVP